MLEAVAKAYARRIEIVGGLVQVAHVVGTNRDVVSNIHLGTRAVRETTFAIIADLDLGETR